VPIGGFCDVTITGLADRNKLAWVTVPEIPVRVYAVWGSGDPILSVPTNKAGTWTLVLGFTDDGGKPVLRKIPLTIGVGPGPGPEPPLPVPPGPTPPTPTPPQPGKRVVWLVYESTATTVPLGQLLTQIRQPPHAAYLASAGHTLAIADDDAVDENGQPPKYIAELRPHWEGMTLPVLFIAEKGTNKVVHKESLPANATAASVIEIVKAND
jgi:hypothetical protein